MAQRKIERQRVPLYNDTTQNIPAIAQYITGTPTLDKADAYSVVVESAAIDLSNAVLNTNPRYEIMIFCDLKADTTPVKPPGLEWGPNYFKFPGELRNVNELTSWFYEILHKKALPFDLGNITLNNDDFFELLIPQPTYDQSYATGYFEVYFNAPLASLLEELCDTTPTQSAGQLFYKMRTSAGKTTQTINTLERCNKIESILLFTSLPVTKLGIADARSGIVRRDAILGTIEFNAGQYNLRSKTDWRYIPSVFRHSTLDSSSPVQSYEVWVMLRYTNGDLRAHVLSPDERANINLAFYPIDGGF